MRKTRQKRQASLRRSLLRLSFIFCICGAVYLIYMSATELLERKQGDDFYIQMAADIEDSSAAADAFTTNERNDTDSSALHVADAGLIGPASADMDERAAGFDRSASAPTAIPGVATSADILDKAASDTAQASKVDFDMIWQTCPDVVGWIKLEDSVIDYPVVQGDDNEFYLNHLADGTPNETGSIMMDSANSGDFSDTVTILHGHHMRSGAMFGNIVDYDDEEYYRAHDRIRLYTPSGDYDVAVFAAFSVNGYTFGYPTSFSDEVEFNKFIRKALSSTPYKTDIEVSYGDRLLMLSTCTYSFEGERYIVLGKIMQAEQEP